MRVVPFRALALVAPGCLGACGNQTDHPPALEGCSGAYDASCQVHSGGGISGGGGGTDSGGDTGVVEDSGALPEDAGTCPTDPMLAAQSPACAACVAAGQDAGLLNCCMADTACSNDQGCVAILQCMLSCTSGTLCADLCLVAPQSVEAYNRLARCIQVACSPPVCPALSTVTAGDQ